MEATLLERGGAKVIILFLCTFRLDSAAVKSSYVTLQSIRREEFKVFRLED
jgi:hypothetical protein